MWAAQYYKYNMPRTFCPPADWELWDTDWALLLERRWEIRTIVINVAGDGCFRMNMNEIATATRNNMPLIQVVVNNQVLGMVRQWQTLFYEGRYSNTVLQDKVDFVKLAEAMGAVGIRVTTKEELPKAIAKAIELNTTVVLDCIIDSDDKVFPMVPAGANIEDAFDEDDLT